MTVRQRLLEFIFLGIQIIVIVSIFIIVLLITTLALALNKIVILLVFGRGSRIISAVIEALSNP